MSEWVMWCIDENCSRLSREDDDIQIPGWVWDEQGNLRPDCEFAEQKIAYAPSGGVTLSGWWVGRKEDTSRGFKVRIHRDVHVDNSYGVICNNIEVAAEMVELIEEYLPSRPTW